MATVAPPARTDIAGTPSNAVAKTAFGVLHDYLLNLLGSVGSPAAAQTALGVYSIAGTDTAISTAVSGINVAQIQPVAASVASNDLTVTINPTKLDFRSTTLTSGTITTVNLASAASLVVPSGATLGTTNSVAARLVILAINNAGTIEAAIINVAGGIDLSETGLISTTAVSTGADSANVAYSTTARTSVAYRVVGYLDISETTAGTWATAPTLVQGGGGQSLQSLNSFDWQDVTGSRAIGTTYYNTTGRTKRVLVRVRSTNINNGATATCVNINVKGSVLDLVETSQYDGAVYYYSNRTVTFDVPAGQSYSITNSVGSNTLMNWREA